MLDFSWFGTAAVVGLLAVCVWHNRRTGYQGTRNRSSLLTEGIAWMDALEASMEPPLPPVAIVKPANAPTDSLFHLAAALEPDRSVAPQTVLQRNETHVR